MSRRMWHPDNPKIIVSNGNWATASFPGQSSFRLGRQEKPWFVMFANTGIQLGDYFPTHAEAITFAQEQATIRALAARFTIPPNPIAAAFMEPTC